MLTRPATNRPRPGRLSIDPQKCSVAAHLGTRPGAYVKEKMRISIRVCFSLFKHDFSWSSLCDFPVMDGRDSCDPDSETK